MKEAELYIKADDFEKSDGAMKKAMSQANSTEKNEIYLTVKDFYKRQAEAYEKNLKRAGVARIYEKLLEMKISDLERKEIKEKLLEIYDKLGKRKEYLVLKKGCNQNP
jgi:mitochondrial fission protein ELM1